MQSAFEHSAQRAAVKAVEDRLAHNDRVRKQASQRRMIGTLGSWLVGLAILAAIGGYYHLRSTGDVSWKGLVALRDRALSMTRATETAPVSNVSMVDAKWRTQYAEVVALFTQGELSRWADAPASVRPKGAPAGTCYHILVPDSNRFSLYEIRSGGSITELSPFGPPLVLKREEFKTARGNKPFLIACAGHVYVSGAGELKEWDVFRRTLMP